MMHISCVVVLCGVVQGQRFLQEIIERIKSSPRHQSSSPSWFGERQFEVIGTGRLPLQNHNLDTSSEVIERHFVEDNFDAFYGDESERRVSDTHALQDREYFPGVWSSPQDTPATPIHSPQALRRRPGTNTYFRTRNTEQGQGRLRQKRSPFKRIKIKVDNPFYFSNPSHPQRRQTERSQQANPLNTKRFDSGPQGFWDDSDFDSHFFDRGHFNTGETETGYRTKHGEQYNHEYNIDSGQGNSYGQGTHEYSIDSGQGNSYGQDTNEYRHKDRVYTPTHGDKFNLGGSQFANVRNYLEREEKNDILGSGNFYIETGGTFYDGVETPYSYGNHQSYNQYGDNFNNFRDFADIKKERLAGRRNRY
jgi:hypothetical protein